MLSNKATHNFISRIKSIITQFFSTYTVLYNKLFYFVDQFGLNPNREFYTCWYLFQD